jgi:hypothetical protein
VRPKASLTGADGWIPICERRLPFEATISLLLTADAQGIAKPIKLERRHAPLVPLDRPLDESVGVALAAWAAGGSGGSGEPGAAVTSAGSGSPGALENRVMQLASDKPKAERAIVKSRSERSAEAHVAWLNAQIERMQRAAA